MNFTQEQSKINATCPGKVVPQGVPIGFELTALEANISFSVNRGKKPLQPMAAIQVTGNSIVVSAIAFIDASISIEQNNTYVIQDLSYTNDGQPFLNLYLCYDNILEEATSFKGYRFDFTVDFNEGTFTPNPTNPLLSVPKLSQLSHLTTFLWDEDPEGSRGTETEVQSGVGI
jgi:hypothetical protein